ncbi:hypothetical protein INT80_09800 [Gallibacterium anatis]|uniref:Uncharacterized protein n=1 Tax=Gallibacterium anatis TaxID=750 RepID=A0A930UXY2_9PAST|nr:hypothetical protein [Gallibacterium anatis]
MLDLNDLSLFAQVVIAVASMRLKTNQYSLATTISRRIAKLEQQLG